jgi:hypothetical protein
MRIPNRIKYLIVLLAAGVVGPLRSEAGVFNTPHFIAPGEFGIGVEPELNFRDDSATAGVNFRYTHGLSDLSNVTGIIGTGGGTRKFRFGGVYTFDFFPDVEKQPGIGIAVQPLYVQLPSAGSVEITVTPYIHKNFKVQQGDIDPFLAVPIGLMLSQGTYKTISTLVAGAHFQMNEHVGSVVELGVKLNNSFSYFSGGIVYYH